MEGFALFLAIIEFIAAILSTILFFKVWGMTNNVSTLTDIAVHKHNDEGSRMSAYFLAAKYKRLGKSAEAIEILNARLDAHLSDLLTKRTKEYVTVEYMQEKWNDYIRRYSAVYSYLDATIPEQYIDFDFVKLMEDVYEMREGKSTDPNSTIESKQKNDYFN